MAADPFEMWKRRWLALLLPLVASGCVGYVSEWPRERSVPRFGMTTPEKLLASKGEPSEKRRDGADEVWIYAGEREWVGVLFFAVVPLPLPLMLPVARERLEVRFRDGAAVSASERFVRERGALCGFVPGPCTWGFGCGTH